MPDLCSYDYAIVRVVPHVEREEFLNVGVLLYCRQRRYLAARVDLDGERMEGIAADVEPDLLRSHLATIPVICEGGVQAGPFRELTQVERFRWLTAPRSTMIQVSAVHGGLCEDPPAALDQLMQSIRR